MLLSTSNNIKDGKNSSVHSDITLAVRRALVLSAVAAAGTGVMSAPAYAQEQSATAGGDEVPTQTVTVTGSRIRRVDTETASPVYTIDNSTIQQSGVSTVGELIMQHLKGLDTVAYIRFASVYRDFKDVNEFKEELEGLLGSHGKKKG